VAVLTCPAVIGGFTALDVPVFGRLTVTVFEAVLGGLRNYAFLQMTDRGPCPTSTPAQAGSDYILLDLLVHTERTRHLLTS
jgi:hypothetical protein